MSCPVTGSSDGSCPVFSSGARASKSAKVNDIVDQLLTLQSEHEAEIAELRRQYQAEIDKLKEGTVSAHARVAEFSVFSYEKAQFLEIVQGAIKGPGSPEYQKLYEFLLSCFTIADNNHDGRVGFHEFEMLLETASSLPRKFGYAPTTPEMYATEWDRLRLRMVLFNSLASSSDGSATEMKYVTFSTWLRYATEHIQQKAQKMTQSDVESKMTSSKDAFLEFTLQATSSRTSKEYKEFYHFALKCFSDADKNRDGQIDVEGFDLMIDYAAAAPRRFGFAPATQVMYKTEAEKIASRRELFATLDTAKRGYIDFDQWLQYIYAHICQKAQGLGKSGEIPRVLATYSSTGNSTKALTIWDAK